MEREQYLALQDEFKANPHKALLELFIGSLEHHEHSAPTAFQMQTRETLRNVKLAMKSAPDVYESYVWKHVFNSWVHMKTMPVKTPQERKMEEFQALSLLVAAGIPITTESPE